MAWKCSCGTVSSLSIAKCPHCGKDKKLGESLIKMRGDWCCGQCGKNNFARRKKCFSCGVNKSGSKSVGFGLASSHSKKRSLSQKESEWPDTSKSKSQRVASDGGAENHPGSSASAIPDQSKKDDCNEDDDDEALLSEI